MGSEESKSHVQHDGEAQVRIINNQNQHTEKLDNQDTLLWCILILLAIQLAFTLISEIRRLFHKSTMKKAKSMLTISNKLDDLC